MDTQVKQNSFAFYAMIFVYVLAALVLRAAMLAPLSALFLFEDGSWWKLLACLTPLILVFIILPLRFSFAQALLLGKERRRFSLKEAFSFSNYASKLGLGLAHGGKILLWGIPTLALVCYALYLYLYGENFAFLQIFPKLGTFAMTCLYGVRNFFAGLFGAEQLVIPQNTMAEGIVFAMLLLMITILFWLWGAVRNSAVRYLWVLSEKNGTTLEKEKRSRLMGRRGEQFGTALVNLALCIPFLVVAALALQGFISQVSSKIAFIMVGGTLPVKELGKAALPLVLDFICLYLTIIPARRLRTSAFVTKGRSRDA